MDLATVTDFVPADAVDWRPGDAFLGGGTWLFSEPQPAVDRLLDLTAFDWPAASIIADGLRLAATCTLGELAALDLPAHWAARELPRQCCTALLGSFKVQHTATVGGNIALALAAAPMISLTAGLDGVLTLVAADGSRRDVSIFQFVTGAGQTVLAPGEYLRSVFLPAAALGRPTAFRQLSLSPVGRSGSLVIGRLDPATGAIAVTVTAATDRPYRVVFERAPTRVEAVDALDSAITRWYDDLHGAPAWRRAITAGMTVDVCAELAAGAAA